MGVFNVGDWLYPDISQGRKPQLGHERLKQGHPLNQGLVGWWLMNEGGGLTAYDLSGKGNHGTLTNGPTWTPGKLGQALSFDGNVPHAVAIPSSFPRVTGTVTISLWVNPSSVATPYSSASLTSDWSYIGRDYNLSLSNTTVLLLVGDGGGSQDAALSTGSVLSVGKWTFVTAVINGTLHKIYIDGVEAASATGSYSGGVTSNPRYIGCDNQLSAAYGMYGKIDDFRIYNRALSAGEVQSLYSDPLAALESLPIIIWAPSAGGTSDIAASGGAVAGGTAALSASYSLAAVAVAVAGGSAALAAAVPLAATGLAIASGSAGAVANVTISATALAQAAGSAGLAAGVTLGASGAGVAGGSAALSSSAAGSIAASGGAVAGGSATLAITVTLAASGSAQAGGSAAESAAVALTAAGGAVAGGAATLSGSAAGSIAASGGAVTGGSALLSATVQISAAGYAQAMGAGALSVSIPLAAFGQAVAGGQAALSTGGSDPDPLIPSGYAADLATIYADFAQTVTHHPAAGGADTVGLAILDEPGTVLLGGEQLATDYGLRYPAYIFASIKRGDTITIDAVTYTAREAAQPIGIDGLEHVVPLARAN